jgi:hypothetical protein
MQLRIPLNDLYAAPGFLGPVEDDAPTSDAARVATLYSFLPADSSFELTDDTLVISRPNPTKKRLGDSG